MEERKEISIRYNFEDKNSVKIGEELGRAPSTISREITRGLTVIKVHGKKKLVYDPTKAELNFQKEKLKRTRNLKIEYHDIWEPIKKYLEIRWSPEQISKEIMKEFGIQVSSKTIYNYIHFHMRRRT